MLKLYTDKSYIDKEIGHLALLYPWFGNCDKAQLDKGRFDDWIRAGKNHISLVTIEKCDAVLLPSEWRTNYEKAYVLASKAKEHNKKLLIFFNSDSSENIPIENTIIFRTSLYKSRRRPNEFALPAWSLDFLEAYLKGKIILREKDPRPTVGYAGYIDYRNWWEWTKYITRYLRHPTIDQRGTHLRGVAVRQLLKSTEIKTNFILRHKGLTGSPDAQSREDYANSIINSDYSLVTRGGGNFSYRLYEVLSCARIPLFIDTDCVLPFDDLISYKDRTFCLCVDQDQIKHIAEAVSKFHASITNEQFKAMQLAARRIYEQWLCPTGFYSNIWRYIINHRS